AHTISTAADGATSVTAEDVDGDGDLDVLSASANDDKIAWYENNGSEVFTPHTITTAADGAFSVTAADVDGDGDVDVLSASFYDDKIAWYENNGSQVFTPHTISTAADGAISVTTADVDGDGDLDVLAASFFDDKIAWYENNAAPVITGSSTITYSENGAAAVINSIVVVGDVDHTTLSSATVTITNFVSGQDVLTFANNGSTMGNIAISSNLNGVLRLSSAGATATLAQWQAALRAVKYSNSSEAPSTTARNITFVVNDGTGNSLPLANTVNVTAVNDAPVITLFDTAITYTENGVGQVLDINTVVTDVDSANFDTGKLTVQLINNGQSTDRLEIRHQGVAAGQVGVNGANVTFGGVLIGTFTGGAGTTALVVTFNTSATPTIVQAVLRNITFRSLSENPSTTARVVRVTLTDGDGGTSNLPTKTINVVAVNDAPVINGFDTPVNYTAGGTGLILDADATVADPDSANVATGKLSVQLISNSQSTDRLEIRNQGVGVGQIGVSGANVTFGGVIIGTFTGGTGSTALVVTFNASATPTMAQAVLRNITFRSTSATPSTLTRSVRVSLTDGDGGISNLPTKQINVQL
ncbi:MAG: hypothetical protein FJ267_05145, partial [Planctomycetes bacterium]|nr:hypothetical protein [Planctomycetota bacterium]